MFLLVWAARPLAPTPNVRTIMLMFKLAHALVKELTKLTSLPFFFAFLKCCAEAVRLAPPCGPVAEYPFRLFFPKCGCDSVKNTHGSPATTPFFHLRLARTLGKLARKSIRRQTLYAVTSAGNLRPYDLRHPSIQ